MGDFELVVHHDYTSGTCADTSGYGNHGYSTTSPNPDGLPFDGRSTRVVVFPAPSLTNLGGIRARVRLRADALSERRTLIEGYLAFSFSIEPDGALLGAVYAGLKWYVLSTPPGIVTTGRWTDVAFVYDGRDTMSLSADGTLIALRQDLLGGIADIEWPYGLNIGAWPDDDVRVFAGVMSELWLWRLPTPAEHR
ncbi:LamG-like jellyroll fold domain-containing protein [Streptomyces chiangmaiensis]|uniref:LamG-like jellyroll fold domain-containing protein n=1 Tax=Streptomyces chiangmaiensis TaxID=766497 RepID=A0ABU7FFB5_9ACTN|nr:LamG-like jellyroll fold domain-containing protein [Streptomyces chiangmaiensis]MED7822836.1 LamG-like jellyroll fold domain-containing protein [Streptomyces chiangmaiensis]